MKKISIISLGCPKNSVDSEHLAGLLEASGLSLVSETENADIALVNTCGFLQAAVEEGIQVILDLERLKQQGVIQKIAVVGCMLNRYGDDLKAEFPTVDYWARSEEWQPLLAQLGENSSPLGRPSGCERALLSGMPWTRYLKISEGCNCRCSYCAIPSIRGRLKSLPVADIVSEAHRLIEGGAREICLVGQELNDYGTDLFGKPSLPLLLDELEKELPRGLWLRLFYLHPSHLDIPFLERVAKSPVILPWLDVPIQHVDDAILRRMCRPPVEQHIWDIFKTGRQINPDFAFRTTLMVGFPGETRAQFDKLLDFVEDIRFDRLGAFTYSAEDGTPAASFPDQIPEDEKNARYNELMQLQQSVSASRQALFVGRELDVLVDEVDAETGERVGRSFRDAPEIDGVVTVTGAESVQPGSMIRVKITESSEYDLSGVMIHE
ncbi:MAG: 30S ribosomal protein S12 methylthiotransferase RimO [Pyramidobacter sp.]|nr:30S ribosomal protein S12 methylthiotransferase RimO [Pyramidobacter sp.]